MRQTLEYFGKTLQGGSSLQLGRIERQFVGEPERLITANDIESGEYTVFSLNLDDGSRTEIEGHSQQPLDITEVVLDEPVSDMYWPDESNGYNFVHQLDVKESPAFPVSGHYQVEYKLYPYAAQVMILRYRIHVI